jgi:hypothetical protein
MAQLAPATDLVVRTAVDGFLAGERGILAEGEWVFDTKRSRYRLLDGVLFAANDASLVGAELVGWLMDRGAGPSVETAWCEGSRAVLVDRRKNRHIVVTSGTRDLARDGRPVGGSSTFRTGSPPIPPVRRPPASSPSPIPGAPPIPARLLPAPPPPVLRAPATPVAPPPRHDLPRAAPPPRALRPARRAARTSAAAPARAHRRLPDATTARFRRSISARRRGPCPAPPKTIPMTPRHPLAQAQAPVFAGAASVSFDDDKLPTIERMPRPRPGDLVPIRSPHPVRDGIHRMSDDQRSLQDRLGAWSPAGEWARSTAPSSSRSAASARSRS